jgi:group I intron endonuclease
MASGIYKITNTINGKCYIGSAVDLERREKQHFSGDRTNKILKQAMKKYGAENFQFEVLEECNPEHCVAVEQTFIDYYKRLLGWENLYNICEVAGSCLGVERTEETKRLMSEASKGRQHSAETKRLISVLKKGMKHSEETRKKMSEAKKGKEHPMYGKQLSAETKRLMSKVRKGKRLGDKNPRYDSTIYLFQHTSGKTFIGTRYELWTTHELNRGTLSNVILGKCTSTKGWMLSYAPIPPPEDA